MDEATLKQRTQSFALRVMKLTDSLGWTGSAGVIGKQLLRSGTSAGANYRAACRGRSGADFVHKLAIAEEELDESGYWMDLLSEAGLVKQDRLAPLRQEAEELLAIIVASIKTAKRKQ